MLCHARLASPCFAIILRVRSRTSLAARCAPPTQVDEEGHARLTADLARPRLLRLQSEGLNKSLANLTHPGRETSRRKSTESAVSRRKAAGAERTTDEHGVMTCRTARAHREIPGNLATTTVQKI